MGEVVYDDESTNRKGTQKAASGLDGKQNTAGSGGTLSPSTAEKIWQEIGSEKRNQIIDQIDLYTYVSEEADFYLFNGVGSLSSEDRAKILEETAKQFFAAMHGNRILLENDGRFRWLGENIALLLQDIEAIEAGTFSVDEDFEQFQQRTYALTDWEVLEHAYDALDKTDLEPGERTALDIFKGRLDALRDLQSRWTKVGQNWYKNSGYFCPPLVSKKG